MESDYECSSIQSVSGDDDLDIPNRSSISIKMEEGVEINISFKVIFL